MDDRGQRYNSLRGASRGVQENRGANTRFPNLGESPCKNKMMAPRYQEISAKESPTVRDEGIWARVIAGECLGVSSSIDTVIPITLIHVKMEEASGLIQEIAPDLNAMIYVFGGRIVLEDQLECTKSPTSIRPRRQTVCERWGISAVVTRGGD